MSLTLKEAYYTEETKMGPQPHYNRKISYKHQACTQTYQIIILRDHLHITKKKRMRNDRYKKKTHT